MSVYWALDLTSTLPPKKLVSTRALDKELVNTVERLQECCQLWPLTSHSAYVATETESNGVKIDGLLPPNFL